MAEKQGKIHANYHRLVIAKNVVNAPFSKFPHSRSEMPPPPFTVQGSMRLREGFYMVRATSLSLEDDEHTVIGATPIRSWTLGVRAF